MLTPVLDREVAILEQSCLYVLDAARNFDDPVWRWEAEGQA